MARAPWRCYIDIAVPSWSFECVIGNEFHLRVAIDRIVVVVECAVVNQCFCCCLTPMLLYSNHFAMALWRLDVNGPSNIENCDCGGDGWDWIESCHSCVERNLE